ncbi:phosphatase PAP2 family protein [Psychrobacter sp. PP-21]|uniref:phosphatase PAP2 family protein n=1 Tax=Psychrobacter sp. PP-21 TaxID=2957503 RepID=UPI0029A40DF7|nr:phosphatase PAP2 family protein [Psychrobacter sp. PP-21]MDX2374473.1 phosphatase PAP2 family protein [Psychrobacter sp. PP-21]
MIQFIERHPQLISLGMVLIFIMALLWLVQHLLIRYGKRALALVSRADLWLREHLARLPMMVRLQRRYPALFGFITERFARGHFSGLILTVSTLLNIYILALFAGLVEDVVSADSIVTTDLFVSQHMSVLRESGIIDFFILITSSGSTPVTCLIILLTAILCMMLRQPYIIIGLLISTIGSTAFTFINKMVFQRARPIDILLQEHTYSFPSGHATISIALYGFLAYMMIRFSQSFVRQVRILSLALLLFLLIGLSRIVLNEHYLSDVIGGFLVGSLWLIIAISIMEWLTARSKINWHVSWSAHQRYMVWFSVVAVLIAIFVYANIYQFPLLT